MGPFTPPGAMGAFFSATSASEDELLEEDELSSEVSDEEESESNLAAADFLFLVLSFRSGKACLQHSCKQ